MRPVKIEIKGDSQWDNLHKFLSYRIISTVNVQTYYTVVEQIYTRVSSELWKLLQNNR